MTWIRAKTRLFIADGMTRLPYGSAAGIDHVTESSLRFRGLLSIDP
jgi:hypothetical protein